MFDLLLSSFTPIIFHEHIFSRQISYDHEVPNFRSTIIPVYAKYSFRVSCSRSPKCSVRIEPNFAFQHTHRLILCWIGHNNSNYCCVPSTFSVLLTPAFDSGGHLSQTIDNSCGVINDIGTVVGSNGQFEILGRFK